MWGDSAVSLGKLYLKVNSREWGGIHVMPNEWKKRVQCESLSNTRTWRVKQPKVSSQVETLVIILEIFRIWGLQGNLWRGHSAL